MIPFAHYREEISSFLEKFLYYKANVILEMGWHFLTKISVMFHLELSELFRGNSITISDCVAV